MGVRQGEHKLRIAAMRPYGTTRLYKYIRRLHSQDHGAGHMRIALATDKRGNAHQVTDHEAKNDTAANILMELALMPYHSRCPLRLTHTYREHNKWADQLACAPWRRSSSSAAASETSLPPALPALGSWAKPHKPPQGRAPVERSTPVLTPHWPHTTGPGLHTDSSPPRT